MQAVKDELVNASRLREGEVIQATLIKKTSRAAYFDIGNLGTGIVFGVELQNSREALKKLSPGEQVAARVEAVDGHMGYLELSVSEAGKQQAWQDVKALEESGEIVSVKITGANQGGLLADFGGLKVFLPISQLSQDHMPQVPDGDRQKLLEERHLGADLGTTQNKDEWSRGIKRF